MKQITLLLMAVLCCMTLPACAKKQGATESPSPSSSGSSAATQSAAPASDGTAADDKENAEATATLAPSSNKTVVTEKTAPEIYWAFDIAYHLKDCKELTGKQAQKIPWSTVKEIGLRQCPVCNPPQYENYVENDG